MSMMYVTHVQAVGPFLRLFGQLNIPQMNQIQNNIDVVVATLYGRAPQPTQADIIPDMICLARFMGKQFRRARIVRQRGANEALVQYVDYGNEYCVKLQEICLLNYQSQETEFLKSLPTQVNPFILTGIFCSWTPQQLNELNADLCGQIVTAAIDAEIGSFIFVNVLWRNENLVNYLVHIKQIGNFIALEEQTKTFLSILTTSHGIAPVRQLHGTMPQILKPAEPRFQVPVQPIQLPSIVQTPQILRMPYRSNEIPPNRVEPPIAALSPPKRSVITFKSNTLMVGSYYDVYCCFVENGPCLFSIHLNSTEDALNTMMNELESMPLRNLTDRPSIGMACVARFSEDNQLYRAVIMTIKPTACQVAYVDYGNTEVVPFANLYEIPMNLLDQKIFAIRFALSGYKELEPLDDALKNTFKDMVLHKQLQLKVMPLEGPPLVQYCELYEDGINVLESLKLTKNKKLTYSVPPPPFNNDMVVIRYVESPKKFFIQKVINIRGFDQMMDDLFLYCKQTHTPLKEFTAGSACAVKFENAWYRAEILGMNQNRVSIRHVDFGNERSVDPGQLCVITERLVTFPVQAIKCCLNGFENAESLSESATVQLEMLAEGADNERRHFKCQIFQVDENGTTLVNLIDQTIRPELDLMKKLFKLSMPFNKYIGLEKEGGSYQPNVVHPPIADHIEVPMIFSSNNFEEPVNNLSSEWDDGTSNSFEPKERSEAAHNQQSYQQTSPKPFKENNSNRPFREQREPPYTTFNGKSGNLPPRFQKQQEEGNFPPRYPKQQDDNRRLKENRPNNQFRPTRNGASPENSFSNTYEAPQSALLQIAIADDEWDDGGATTASTPHFTTSSEEYIPLDFTFSRAEFAVPRREEIMLCWWVSPHQFYTHNSSRVSEFEGMMRQIQVFYKNKSPAKNLSIEVGSKIIARYPKDQVLYRAAVLACNEALRKYRVEFIDFGNQATVTISDIWQIEKRFTQVAVMAELCSFDGVVSNYDHKHITSQVEKYLQPGVTLYCNYLEKENNLYYADIEVKGKSLKDLLIEDGTLSLAEPDLNLDILAGQQIKILIVSIEDLLNFQVEIEGCNLKLLSSYNDIKFIKSNEHLSREFKANYVGKSCVADVIDVSKEKILMLQPIIPLFTNDVHQRICDYPIVFRSYNVKMAFIQTENILYAHPIDVNDNLAVLLDEMYNFYSEQGSQLRNFNAGTICAVLSSDENWYRARINNSDESIEVYYIDYGNSEIIEKTENMKILEDQFCKSSAFAIRFYFPIKRNSGDDNAAATVKTLTEGYELTICIMERYKNCWIADIQSNGISLATVLKDEHSWTQGIDMQYVKNIIDNDSSREIISQAPVAMQAPQITAGSPERGETDSGILSEQLEESAEVANSMISAYLSHCDNPGRFFLHLTSTYPELEKLQDNIQIVAGSLPALMTAVSGALCIALYTVDDTWYRARIIDSEIMAVQFIDYGNTDVLTDSSYLKEMNEAFENIPAFAIPCALPISPKTTTDWVDEANKIFTSAYEKTIQFDYITKNPKKNYVNLKIDGQSVADKLISDGNARKLEVLKSGEKGFVSHINNLSDFYIQMESYADGLELIAGHLAGFESFPLLKDNSIGVVCAGIFPEDSGWYRAKILSKSSDGTEVLFIDYGNTAVTNELREISSEIANLPFLSKKCSLRMPDHILGWSDAAEAKFHELSAMGETVFVVELIEPSDHAIIDLFIDERNILEELEPLCDKRPNIEIDLNSSMGKEDFTPNDSLCGSNKLKEVIISHVNAPTDFYIQLQSERAELDGIVDALNNGVVCEQASPEVGMICSAVFVDDGSCYRAKVLSIDANEGSEVLFIDFGNSSVSNDLRILPENLKTKPALAYHCTLNQHGTVDLFSQSSIDEFFTFTAEYECELFEVEILSRTEQPWIVSLTRKGVNILEEMEKLRSKLAAVEQPLESEEITNSAEQVRADTVAVVKEIIDTAINKVLETFVNGDQEGEEDTATLVREIINTAISTSLKAFTANDVQEEQSVIKELIKSTINACIESFASNEAEKDQDETAKDTTTMVRGIIDIAINSSFEENVANEVQEEQTGTDTLIKTSASSEPAQKKEEQMLPKEIIDTAITTSLEASVARDLREAVATVDEIIETSIESVAANKVEKEQEKTTLVKEILDAAITSGLETSVLNEEKEQANLDLDKKDIEDTMEIVITHTNSPNDFYFRLLSAEQDLNEVNKSLMKAEDYEKVTNATIGTICAALCPKTNTYHRVKVLSVDDDAFDVEFIDSGNRLQSLDLRILPEVIRTKEALAKHGALKTNFSNNVTESFKFLVTSKLKDQLQMKIIDRKSDPWIVRLTSNRIDLEEQLAATEVVLDAVDVSIEEVVKNAVVSHTNTPNDFYIQLSCDMKNLEKITERLADAESFSKPQTIEVGMMCAAVFPDDGAFYRAKILSVLVDGSCDVLFVDFGNVSVSNDIRQLPMDLIETGFIAKHCALENISETDFWSEQAIELFNSLITSHFGETFQVEIISNKQQPWIVKLFSGVSNLCDELKKSIHEQNNVVSQESSDVWEEAHNSTAAIIASDLIDNLIDTIDEKTAPCTVANGTTENADDSQTISNSDVSVTSAELAEQLWEGLHRLGITDPQTKWNSTSDLSEPKSITNLLSVQNDSGRSKSADCMNTNN